ncbi:hypothetical protein P280DRAFT_537880 [Massarina eburnea CBS 473.64]|uniref:Amidase signature enzyme n=1 Tax=Massarina eburnea CBS 473.64 TaxID=1395130 RepID=A0A6A6SBK0_9PLEO|nr:hypothetical protein P280DRAFT_537880 [Massarina eburnea CBS 473.64]
MHPAGVVTGLVNKAYAQLYGKQQVIAKFITLLVNKGAVIIGKTKLSPFAGSEIPPNQCIDYFPRWNARGDSYLSLVIPRSMFCCVLIEASGSLRHAASSHGAWGHRITWGHGSLSVGLRQ